MNLPRVITFMVMSKVILRFYFFEQMERGLKLKVIFLKRFFAIVKIKRGIKMFQNVVNFSKFIIKIFYYLIWDVCCSVASKYRDDVTFLRADMSSSAMYVSTYVACLLVVSNTEKLLRMGIHISFKITIHAMYIDTKYYV